MKRIFIIVFTVVVASGSIGYAGFLDSFLKNFGLLSEQELDGSTIISGLKEALSVGTENAVKDVSKIDGYLANEAIAILMPEKFQYVADALRKVGFEKASVFLSRRSYRARTTSSCGRASSTR